ncbi:MAG: hypothetical protein M1576_00170 [Deltaproteobacteria bacterium]|jgi:hypothetical protein|nr:hypothetical protein [Deltaproteobacteria bacterium]
MKKGLFIIFFISIMFINSYKTYGFSLSTFFNSLIPHSNANNSNQINTNSNVNDKSSVINILDTEASAAKMLGYGECYNVNLNKDFSREANEYKLGEYLNAGAFASGDAKMIAECYSSHNLTTMTAAYEVGSFLALSALAYRKAGETSQNVLISARNAKTLLKYTNKGSGLISKLKKAGLLGINNKRNSHNVALNTTAVNADSELINNSFRFRNLYNNKTIEITGIISSISSLGNGAELTIKGVAHKNRNHIGAQDFIYCDINNKTSLKKLYSLQKGQSVTVMGVYVYNEFEFGVNLSECTIK